jgi:hypothetical protein
VGVSTSLCTRKMSLTFLTMCCCRTWDVEADKSWTVERLKAHLKEEHKLEGKKIRLISLGRMLADPSTIVRTPCH